MPWRWVASEGCPPPVPVLSKRREGRAAHAVSREALGVVDQVVLVVPVETQIRRW